MKLETIQSWLQDQSVNRKIQEFKANARKWQQGRRVQHKAEYSDPFMGLTQGSQVLAAAQAWQHNLEAAAEYYRRAYPQAVNQVLPFLNKVFTTGKFSALQGDLNGMHSSSLQFAGQLKVTAGWEVRKTVANLKEVEQMVRDGSWPEPGDDLFPPAPFLQKVSVPGAKAGHVPIEFKGEDLQKLLDFVIQSRQGNAFEQYGATRHGLLECEKRFIADVNRFRDQVINDKNPDEIGDGILENYMQMQEGEKNSPFRYAETDFERIFTQRYKCAIVAWTILSRSTGFFSSGSIG